MSRFDQVPLEVWDALSDRIHADGLDFTDNYRAFRVRDMFLAGEFAAAEAEGCCGTFEMKTWHGNDEWVVACNYGH